jgi:hypothetical protein
MAPMFISNTITSSNWMSFILIQMSGQIIIKEVGRTLARKMLKKNDIYVAVSVLIGIGEHADIIEMYTLYLYYIKAILLAYFKFPTDFYRYFILVRRWGKYIIISSRQLLAIRCLFCININSSESWASLNTEIAEYLINYTRKIGLDPSAPSQLSPFMPLLGPA